MQESLLPASGRMTFLAGLQSSGRHRYARYNGLPLRYAGGKSLAVGHILEHLPDDVELLASPFLGGGSVEIACAKELRMRVRGYDLFDVLANYWKVQLRSPMRLADRIEEWTPTKTNYAKVKSRLKAHWNRTRPIEDRLELAAHYWFNHNLSYGPGFLGWMSRIYEDRNRFARLVGKVRTFRCPNLKVEQGTFQATMPKHERDFLYCDPPYYLDGDSRMFRGIYPQRNFPVHHRGLTTPRCAKFCGRTRAASSSPTTTAKPSENGILAAAYSRSSGNTPWARAKPESAKTASKTAPATT